MSASGPAIGVLLFKRHIRMTGGSRLAALATLCRMIIGARSGFLQRCRQHAKHGSQFAVGRPFWCRLWWRAVGTLGGLAMHHQTGSQKFLSPVTASSPLQDAALPRRTRIQGRCPSFLDPRSHETAANKSCSEPATVSLALRVRLFDQPVAKDLQCRVLCVGRPMGEIPAFEFLVRRTERHGQSS